MAKNNMPYRFSAQETPIVSSSAKSKRNATLKRVDPYSYLSSVRAPTHGVFGSDTYFSSLKVKDVGIIPVAADLAGEGSSSGRLRTPSIRSEASSFNSQTALVPSLHRNGSQAKQKKAANGRGGRRRSFLGFGCGSGSCFDKKGVHINPPPPSRLPSQRIDHHLPSAPVILDPAAKAVEMVLEESRKSIEVFGSRTATFEGEVARNMERKLSMLSWDAIPRAQSIEASRNGDDVASDASSDLFEIENITTSRAPIASADVDVDASSLCTSPASRYAPSEVSIQWSVVTAAEFNDDAAGKGAQRGRNGGILGCRSLKAVDVTSKNLDKAKHESMELLSLSSGKLLPAAYKY